MRLPTFTDLYYTAANYIGNPDLKPERAVTYRFAADYSRERWNVSARLYYRDGHNLIDWVKPSPEADWESCQITSLDTYGAEGRAVYATEGFLRRLVFSYGYLTQSKHSEGISKYALDYMRHKAAVSAEVRFLRRFSIVLTGSVYDRAGSYARPRRGDEGLPALFPARRPPGLGKGVLPPLRGCDEPDRHGVFRLRGAAYAGNVDFRRGGTDPGPPVGGRYGYVRGTTAAVPRLFFSTDGFRVRAVVGE